MKKLMLVVLLLCLCIQCSAAQKVVMISWDGAADWIMDRLLQEGAIPNIARIAENGVRADYTTSSFPSKTAAAHASIWTGTYTNGVTNNQVPARPYDQHFITELQSGFVSNSLNAEPIWMTVVKSGRSAAIINATQTYPSNVYTSQLQKLGISDKNLMLINQYDWICGSGILTDTSAFKEQQLPNSFPSHSGTVIVSDIYLGKAVFSIYLFDSPTDPVNGYDSAFILDKETSETAVIKPGLSTAGTTDKFSPSMEVRSDGKVGYVNFRLFDLSPDGSSYMLYHTNVSGASSNKPQIANAILKAAGGTVDLDFSPYENGAFGKQVYTGGDGTAEKRLLEIVQLHTDKFRKATIYGVKNLKWDLIINYDAITDSAGHCWVGGIDPDNPFLDKKYADMLWPYLKEVYRLNDAALGAIYDSLPRNGNIVLFSDHGMAGGSKKVYVNRILERAGLLKFDDKGKIDLSATKIAAVADGSLYVNVIGRNKGGIVPQNDMDKILNAARTALLSAVDPETGRVFFTKVFNEGDGAVFGLGYPNGADMIVNAAPGYAASSSSGKPGEICHTVEPIGFGQHGGYPYQRGLMGILYAAGSGITKDKVIPGIRLIDIAPTVCRLMGIPSPRDATGIPVVDMLR